MRHGPLVLPPRPITYAQYMTEDIVKRRYDIINGVRVFAVPPSLSHQRTLAHLAALLHDFGRDSGAGECLFAPFDVLISREPFRTRQPDVLFISRSRLAAHGPDDGRPLSTAPELVIEVLSSVDRALAVEDKIADYRMIGVEECWVVRSEEQTVEVIRLSWDEIESVAICGRGQTVASSAFPGLTVRVDEVLQL